MRSQRIAIAISLLLTAVGTAFAAEADDLRLLNAAKNGNHELALSALSAANSNAAEPDGTTALHWAARFDDLELADRLIAAGASATTANRYQITPLYLAAENGSASMIEKLLDAGASANDAANMNETALMTVARTGSIDAGACANDAANMNETALMTVARTGSIDAAKVLLDRGAQIDATEEWHGQTALMWAIAQGHADMTAFLIDAGADVNKLSDVNEWERQNTMEPRAKWLPAGGLTPLLFAAREGCLDCARILVNQGADLQVQDPLGVSALLMAIINGHYDVAGYLIDAGTNPNLADETGRAPLFSAVDFNTMPVSNRPSPNVVGEKLTALDLVAKLLEAGAEIDMQLTRQQPYRTKLDRGDDTMLSTGTTPLLRAAKAADLPAMKILLNRGADVHLPTRTGITPLMAAAGVGTKEEDTTGRFKTEEESIQAVQLLLDHGADINAMTEGRSGGETALHAAAKWGFDKVVAFLVEKGANLEAQDARGFTPLDSALGLAGGAGGFDGSRRDVHESTAKLIVELMEARGLTPRTTAESGAATPE